MSFMCSIYLKPGEKLTPCFLEKLKSINMTKKKYQNFLLYKEQLGKLLHCPHRPIDEKYKRFLGGFILGEGSINVFLKKDKGTKYQLALDPQFSVTQHISKCSFLHACLEVFQTGRIYYKSGSNDTLVFAIDSRQSIKTKLVPFWEKYISPFMVEREKKRFKLFCSILDSLERGEHLSGETFGENLLPLWDALRVQRGQKNESFHDLKSAQLYLLSKMQE